MLKFSTEFIPNWGEVRGIMGGGREEKPNFQINFIKPILVFNTVLNDVSNTMHKAKENT